MMGYENHWSMWSQLSILLAHIKISFILAFLNVVRDIKTFLTYNT